MPQIASRHISAMHIKLAIAPQANHRLRSDSVDKLPPAMIPAEALNWLSTLRQEDRDIKSIELNGPGDALALPQITIDALKLLKPVTKDTDLSITSLGVGAASRAKELADLGVQRINLMVDTVQAACAAKLYSWIRPGKKNVPLAEAVQILITEQAKTTKAMSKAGISVVIRTRLRPDITGKEIGAIAMKMAALGATKMELIPANAEACALPLDTLQSLTTQAAAFLPTVIAKQNTTLPAPGAPQSYEDINMAKPTDSRPNVAVVSSNGMDVDMHLGQALRVLIYGPRDDGLTCLLSTRTAPAPGISKRWQTFADDCLSDCFAILATHAGAAPRDILAERGIKLILCADNIAGLVDVVYGGGKKNSCKK